jgi:hypothetical protein
VPIPEAGFLHPLPCGFPGSYQIPVQAVMNKIAHSFDVSTQIHRGNQRLKSVTQDRVAIPSAGKFFPFS